MMGAERRSMVMSEDEKKMTAYHEAGHAICTLHCEHADPIHKATIIPRGRALGMVMQLPERDNISYSKAKLKDRLVTAFGGRVSEELIFGAPNVSTGAESDIRMATQIARRMVTEWGMSDIIGPVAVEEPDGEVFLGYSMSKRKAVSEEMAAKIDREMRAIIDEAYERSVQILNDYRHELEMLAEALLEYETLSGEEIQALLRGEKIMREEEKIVISPRTTVPVSEEQNEDADDKKQGE